MQVKPDFTVPMRDMIEEGISRPIEVLPLAPICAGMIVVI